MLLRRTFQATLQLTGQVAMVDDPDTAVVEPYLHLPAELIGGEPGRFSSTSSRR